MSLSGYPVVDIPLAILGAFFIYALVAGGTWRTLQAWVTQQDTFNGYGLSDQENAKIWQGVSAALWPACLPFILLFRLSKLAWRAGSWRPAKKSALPEARVVKGGEP